MATRTDAATMPPAQEEVDSFVLDTLPRQGWWQEAEYLWLTDHSNRLVELTDGCIEVLPMPTEEHQCISAHLYGLLLAYLQVRGGKVLYAPLRLRVRSGAFREPDLLLVRDAADPRRGNRFWTGADLVVEVMSPDRPERDRFDKRRDYAAARIPEYWIVDPDTATVTVLVLAGDEYREHGTFRRGTRAASHLLQGFYADVAAIFDSADA